MKETCPRPLEASEGIEGILVCHTIWHHQFYPVELKLVHLQFVNLIN
jgi:hypothetical protein